MRTASAKALRPDCAQNVKGIARRPVCLEQNEGEKEKEVGVWGNRISHH